jgi:hypothetical protein
MKFRFLHILLLSVLAFGIWGCNKNSDDIYVTPDNASLRVYHAINIDPNKAAEPTSFNIYQNGTRISNSANIYVGGYSPYLSVLAGEQRFSVKTPYDVLSTNNDIAQNDTLFSKVLPLDSGKQYSLFVSGKTADKAFLVIDSSATAGGGKVWIRFVHAASTAGPLRITLNDTNLEINNTKYQSVHSLAATYAANMVIKVYKGNSTTPIATSQALSFTDGQSYTIFARDSVNSIAISRVIN